MPGMYPEAAIARLAAVQEGNVTFAQLRAGGLSRDEIRTRERRGALTRRYRGVYAVGHVPGSWFSGAFAAWLARGPASALSFTACAAALGVLPEPEGPIHLTRATGGTSEEGMVLHQGDLTDDTWHRRGLVMTSPARLMLDLAATQPRPVVERAYNQAQVLRLITPGQVASRMDGWHGRRGVTVLRSFLDDRGATRSELEDAFRRLVRAAGLPEPEFNQWIDGVLVDAVWRTERVVVELDSRAFHGHDRAFEADREKNNRLILRRWTPLRFTYPRITREPLAVVAEVVAALNRSARSAA